MRSLLHCVNKHLIRTINNKRLYNEQAISELFKYSMNLLDVPRALRSCGCILLPINHEVHKQKHLNIERGQRQTTDACYTFNRTHPNTLVNIRIGVFHLRQPCSVTSKIHLSIDNVRFQSHSLHCKVETKYWNLFQFVQSSRIKCGTKIDRQYFIPKSK